MPTSEEKFWNQVDVGKNGACWIWKGKKEQGYGKIYFKGKRRFAHRVAWELTNGSIPEGLLVLHSCDEPACVNPAHLWLGTQADNMKDMREKGRDVHGEQSPHSRLTEEQVKEILRIHGEGKLNMKEISKLVDVHYNTVRRIINREDWKHVD
jgi:hypothetical protein